MLQLTKGKSELILSKDGATGSKKIKVELGWKPNDDSTMKHDFDLDVSVLALNAAGKLAKEQDFVFYNNICNVVGGTADILKGKSVDEKMKIAAEYAAKGSYLFHLGDNRTGEGEGADEIVVQNLDKVPADIKSFLYVISIHEADKRGQFFSMVEGAFARVVDDADTVLCNYNLTEKFDVETGVVIGELFRSDEGDFKFKATGKGFTGDLNTIFTKYS